MTTAIPIVSPDDQRVTFVELFFDLVFVFCVTQVVAPLHGHVDLRSVGSALLVFWLVWWAWTQFTRALNAAKTDHPRVQGITLLATAVAFFLAVGIPRALGAGAVLFVAATAAAIWRATRRFPVWRGAQAPAAPAAVIAVGAAPWLAMSLLLAMLIAVAVGEERPGVETNLQH